jgi:phage-related protein
VAEIASAYFDETGADITVTDGTRTAEDQASAMYNNLENGEDFSLYKDQAAAQEIKDAYDEAIDADKSKEEAIKDMTGVIQDQIERGVYISNHLEEKGDRAFDVRINDMTTDQRDAFQKAAENVGAKVINEGDHFHVQF